MVNRTYNKSIRRTIFGSIGRYIAILAIIALGVGFFAGVKNTKASMMETCNEYVTEHNMHDYRLVSTYGFTKKDEAALNKVKEVEFAEGSYTTDFFSADNGGNSIIIRAHSITDNINTVDLQEGRMPKSANECLVDDHFFTADDIGKVIKVTNENDKDTKKALEYREYKITGITKSTYYLMKTERGTTSLGDGSITAYIYIPKGGFTSEYFTEMFVTCKEQGYIFSDEYKKNMDYAEGPITAAAEKRGQIRYDNIIEDAEEELAKGRSEFEDGKQELADGRRELADGRAKFKREKSDALAKLKDAKRTLDDKKKELADGKTALASSKSDLKGNKAQAEAGLKQAEAALAAAQMNPDTPAETIAQLQGQIAQLTGTIQQIDAGLEQISQNESQIKSGEKQLKDGYEKYYDNKKEAESEFAKAERKFADGEAELADAEEKLADAEKELKDAEKEIAEIEKPELYVQTREDNLGFGSFESNSDIVDSIAKVFPVFFFLIAALVCSTTMSRMIEEERTQIGALRALGFTNGRIMWKYMVYSGSAALIGCIAGFLLGSKFFPYFIWIAYGMMFGFASLEYYFDVPLAVISLAVALICSTGTTYFACRGQLKHTPAEILRPKAPKAGKRILLERIGFIWNHLKFLHKVSARNILRYKKRMVMMILGIGGCTALVLAGFGINDSVAGIADHQYSEIEKYDMTVAFSETIDEKKLDSFNKTFDDDFKSTAVLQQTSVNIIGSKATKSANLMITGDSNITKAVNFSKDGEQLDYPEKGEVLINNKMADIAGVEEGGTITLEYDDTKQIKLKVAGVYRNYVSNYIYINDETYENLFNKKYEPSIIFVSLTNPDEAHKVSERINNFDDVIGISLNEDIRNRVDDMMVSLNYIIILVIACAGALAFIVLFNLGNINITEREREIATIEVLGFYPRELGAYVFRENMILVLFGIMAGLPLGFVLHKFIMSRIIVDAVSFNEVIEPVSYVFTVIVVICFAVIVDVIMRRKLKRINMAEALKSVE